MRTNAHVVTILLIVAVSLLQHGVFAGNGQAVGAGAQETRRVPDLLFDPLHQRPLSYADDTLTIKLLTKEEKLFVEIQRSGISGARQLALPEDMAQVNEIRRVQPDKAVVIGNVQWGSLGSCGHRRGQAVRL